MNDYLCMSRISTSNGLSSYVALLYIVCSHKYIARPVIVFCSSNHNPLHACSEAHCQDHCFTVIGNIDCRCYICLAGFPHHQRVWCQEHGIGSVCTTP